MRAMKYKRKTLVVAMLCAMIAIALGGFQTYAVVASAEETTQISGTNVAWAITSQGTLVISGTGEVPDFDGATSPWYNNENVKKILIQESVERIGTNAFVGLTNLKTIEIASTVKSIADNNFVNCPNVETVSVPCHLLATISKGLPYDYEVTVISHTFEDGQGYTARCVNCNLVNMNKAGESVYYLKKGGTLTLYGEGEMTDYASLENVPWNSNIATINKVVIEEGITRIGKYAFAGCSSLKNVKMASTIESIGYKAFANCGNLSAIILPKGLTSIEKESFAGSGIQIINIPKTVTNLSTGAFRECKSLRVAAFAGKLDTIFSFTFDSCESLTLIEFPDTLEKIESFAFNNCPKLKKIHLPSSFKTVYKDAFRGDDIEEVAFACGAVYDQNAFLAVGGFDNAKFVQDAHVFDWSDEYFSEDGKSHYRKCYLCGAKSEAEACIEADAVMEIVVPATCVKDGSHVEVFNCKICKQKLREATVVDQATGHIDANKDEKCDVCDYDLHVHAGEAVKQIEATCTRDGIKAYYKCNCGKFFSDEKCTKMIADLTAWKTGAGKIAKKGHKGGVATCTKQAKCTVCGEEYGAFKAHDIKKELTKATFATNGKIEEKCKVCGQISKTTVIYAAEKVALNHESYVYDGKTKKPTVSLKDANGKTIAATNYTVTYPSGRKNVGKYTVKVTLRGNYSGVKKLTFKVLPKPTTISKIEAKSNGFTVKWAKRTKQVTGYQIQYSTSSSFGSDSKYVKIKANKTTSKTINKLQAKKKYYVRVRTYKTVNKKTYYGAWSPKKNITTLK